MDLTEAKDIKMRWQEYTELYNKGLYNPDNHNGFDHLPRARLLSSKSSGLQKATLGTKLEDMMEFQLSYFKS